MRKLEPENKTLIKQSIKLVALGLELEQKRDVVRRIAEVGIEPTMEMFRAIDDYNIAKMEFEALEQEHLVLRNKLIATQKHPAP